VKRSKYHNVRTQVGGVSFASRREAEAWVKLLAAQKAGRITNLRRQVRFPLQVNGVLVCVYVADFAWDDPDWDRVVADAKGYKTDVYKLKRKLMKAVYNIDILEL
jgi:hypothetical protein